MIACAVSCLTPTGPIRADHPSCNGSDRFTPSGASTVGLMSALAGSFYRPLKSGFDGLPMGAPALLRCRLCSPYQKWFRLQGLLAVVLALRRSACRDRATRSLTSLLRDGLFTALQRQESAPEPGHLRSESPVDTRRGKAESVVISGSSKWANNRRRAGRFQFHD